MNGLFPRGKAWPVPAPPAVETRQDCCYNLYKDRAVICRIKVASVGKAAVRQAEKRRAGGTVLCERRCVMKRGLEKKFNRDVENYRKALLYHARISDWETFKAKAGKMFDYVEAIEYSELERRFFKNFNVILVVLIVIVVAFFNIDFGVTPELMRIKNAFVLTGLGVSSFELYFYVDYRIYMRVKTVHYSERRERFIRNIESDFRSYVLQSEERKAA
jgi:hypothetical protein